MDYTKTANKEMAKKVKGKRRKLQNNSKKITKSCLSSITTFALFRFAPPTSIDIGWPHNCAIGSPEAHHYSVKINLILKISALLKYLQPVFLIEAYWEM